MHNTLPLSFGSGARQSEESLRGVPQKLTSVAPAPLVRRETRGRQMSVSGLPQDRLPELMLTDGREQPKLKSVFTLFARSCAAYLTTLDPSEPSLRKLLC